MGKIRNKEIKEHKPKQNRQGTTIVGMLPYQARKVARFVFRDFFVQCNPDLNDLIYELHLKKEIDGEPLDKEVLEDFVSNWGGKKFWRIILTKSENELYIV